MSVEFVRHENASAMGAVWEHEGSSLFDQYGESSCSERRNISEYMTSSFGPVASYRNVYKDCMASMKNKIGNSYNVTGSDWSLRRIIATNLSVVFNNERINRLYSPRLVKGRFSTKPISRNKSKIVKKSSKTNRRITVLPIDMLESMFEGCYQQIKLQRLARSIRQRMIAKTIKMISKKPHRSQISLMRTEKK